MSLRGEQRGSLGRQRCESSSVHQMQHSLFVPVLIAGAGPVGLILSVLLAKLGVKSLVIEKRIKFLQHPQAHFINNRTMEIFRRVGTLSKDIETLQPPVGHWKNFVYCSSLTGPILGVVDHLRPQDLTKKNSPTWVGHFSQHRLLPLLIQQAERYGVQVHEENNAAARTISNETLSALGEVKLGHKCICMEETSEGVKAGISITGRDHLTVNCAFLVGTDGASSTIRSLMDVKMEGEHALQNLISIHFSSIELAQQLAKNRPGMLYFVFNRNAIGVLVAHDLRAGEFVVQVPFFPPQQRFEDFTPEVCKHIILALAGASLTDMDIKSVKPWAMHAQVAERFLSSHKRVLLAGDAAHRFPPAGGFGMNTGIQDAHNLAWKLAAVLNGVAPLALLSTYEAERQPIAKANTALSLENFKAAMSIPSALGLDPANARLVHQVIDKQFGSILPGRLQSTLLEGIFAIGRAQLSPLILNTYNPLGWSRLQRLRRILEEGKSLQLQFPAEDLGFRYKSGAICGSDASDDGDEQESRRRDYKPVCKPGVRIPHLFVKYLDEDSQGTNKGVLSTLDLITGGKLEFIAFVGPNGSGQLWGESLLHVAKCYHVDMKVVVVWPAESKRTDYEETKGALGWGHDTAENVVHVEEVGGNWWEICRVRPCGAIMVRPDDHVAWVSSMESSSTSVEELQHVFASVLQIACKNG